MGVNTDGQNLQLVLKLIGRAVIQSAADAWQKTTKACCQSLLPNLVVTESFVGFMPVCNLLECIKRMKIGSLPLLQSPLIMSVCLHRMKEGQKDIFYMAADSLDAASSAPFVERLVQRDYEVIAAKVPCISSCWGWAATALMP